MRVRAKKKITDGALIVKKGIEGLVIAIRADQKKGDFLVVQFPDLKDYMLCPINHLQILK